jgi:predicted phage terminase large subunit-like protein
MFSRNRSKSAVRSYIRATTNPDADSWVAGFIEWWIDQKTGLPIKERAGVVRWLVRDGERNFWFDTQKQAADFAAERFAELMHELEPEQFVKSVTFIPADVFDNPALLRNDPGYLANLLALPLVERERLLKGNWKVRATAGKVFNRDWFEIVDAMPQGGIDVRFFDLAATEKKLTTNAKKTDPDYTATVKIRFFLRPKEEPLWIITDAFQVQAAPAQVEKLVMQCAEVDRYEARVNGTRYMIRWEQEPGSASKRESYRWTAALRGYDAKGISSRDDKVTRALALSAQAEQGRVKLLRGSWNGEFLTNLHGFPDLLHDDLVDAASGAFNASDTSGLVLTD